MTFAKRVLGIMVTGSFKEAFCKNQQVIATIAAAISATASLFAIWQTGILWNAGQEASKPYFSLKNPGIEKTDRDPPFELRLTFNNIGVRPAEEFRCKVFVLERPLEKGPYFYRVFSSPNNIAPGDLPTWREGIVGFKSSDVPTQFYVVSMKYRDAVTNKQYKQVFYLVWGGLKQGEGAAGFSHASSETALELKKSLEERPDGSDEQEDPIIGPSGRPEVRPRFRTPSPISAERRAPSPRGGVFAGVGGHFPSPAVDLKYTESESLVCPYGTVLLAAA